jgi:hypothetical protein
LQRPGWLLCHGCHPDSLTHGEEGRRLESAHNDQALRVLKEQGFEIGESVTHDGCRRIWIRSKDDSALVELGPELWELAAGRLTLADANVQRERRNSESRGGW